MKQLKLTYKLLICLLLITLPIMADPIGSWRTYPSYSTIEEIEIAGSSIFVKASSNLYCYNTNDESVTTYETIMSQSIKGISWNKWSKSLILTYDDSNLNILYSNGDIQNIPDLKEKQITGDKTINNITHNGQYSYIATNFGIVKIDSKNGFIADSYILNKPIKYVAFIKDYIYALTLRNGVLRAKLSDNLNDPASWSTFTKVDFEYIFTLNGKLIGMTNGNVNTINTETAEVLAFGLFPFTWAKIMDDRILCGIDNNVTEILSDLSYHTYEAPTPLNSVAYSKSSNAYWSNNANNMLTRYALQDTSLEPQTTGIVPGGPWYNSSYRLLISQDNRLYVTAGGWSQLSVFNNPGEVMYMDNNRWNRFESEGLESLAGGRYMDINSLDVDPRDPEHVMVAGFNGLYEFRSGKCVRRYGVADGLLTYDNNPSKDYHVIVTRVKYLPNGDLYIFNSHSSRPIAILRNSAQKLDFLEDYAGFGEGESTTYDLEGITLDGDNMWFCNAKAHYAVLFRYNLKEEKMYAQKDFFDQDGNIVKLENIYTVAKDHKNNIWIGTDKGPFYIKPSDVNTMTLTHHKVPRNDGTNYADYLLNGIATTSIAVDGGNRKWIGTGSNGVFLISDDCNTQLHHFTSGNSMLKSNLIYDIAINGKTGCVYFATDDGLCSYMSDASESTEELDYTNVTVYPNPVTPDYTGYITVTGLEYNSQVIITTSSGQKVAEGRSNGGSFSWDGCNFSGRRVASGIYMVHIAKQDGSSGIATKIAIVR